MDATVHAQGPTLARALTTALAEHLGCDEEKVDLRLDAPGLDDVTGAVTLALEVAPPADPAPAQETGRDAAHARDDAGEPAGDQQGPGIADEGAADEDAVDEEAAESTQPELLTSEELDEEADAAADFLEGLLDAIDLPGDLRIRVLEDHAEVEVIDIGSGALIGRRGQTLDAIQELVRCALQRRFERRCHVQVDAEGYRARRLDKLMDKAQEAIDDVLDSGEPERLEPMDVFERKAVHQLVSRHDGVSSHSQGREPGRRVVIEPA